jgi:hypothetical protein
MRVRNYFLMVSMTFGLTAACSTAPEGVESELHDTASGRSNSQSLWKASSADCNAGVGGRFLGCKAVTVSVTPPSVTTPTRDILKETLVRYTYDFLFKCHTASQLYATLDVNGGSHRIPASIEGAHTVVTIDVPLSSDAEGTLSIGSHLYSVDRNCTLTLEAVTAVPTLGVAQRLVEYVGPHLLNYSNAYFGVATDRTPGDVSSAARSALTILAARLSSIVTEWQTEIMKARPIPPKVNGLCKSIRQTWEVAGGFDEFGDINIQSYALLSSEQKARVKSECLTVDGRVNEGSLRMAIKSLNQVCAAPDSSECTSAKETVRHKLDAGRKSIADDLQAVADFIEVERQRLARSVAEFEGAAAALIANVNRFLSN